MPHIRYLNAFEGRRVERWQYKNEREPLVDIGTRGKTWSHFHLKSNNWADVPGGSQRLCARRHPLDRREGTEIALPSTPGPTTFARVRHFGGWLRLTGSLPAGVAVPVIVHLALKE